MLLSQLILKPFDPRAAYLNKLSAPGTDQVVMVLVSILMFKPHPSIPEIHLSGQAGFTYEFQRPIHGSVANATVSSAHYPIELIGGQMLFHLQKEIENLFPLAGPAEIMLDQIADKYFLCLLHPNPPKLDENDFHYYFTISRIVVNPFLPLIDNSDDHSRRTVVRLFKNYERRELRMIESGESYIPRLLQIFLSVNVKEGDFPGVEFV